MARAVVRVGSFDCVRRFASETFHSAQDDKSITRDNRRLLKRKFGGFGSYGNGLFAGQHHGFAPVGVASGDHYVEDPLMALFFGFDQALVFQGPHVVLDPLDLFPAQAAALNVYSDAGEMGRSNLAFRWGRIAIMAAKLLLNFYGPDCRIYLDLRVKTVVVRGAEIIEKFTRPGTAVAPVRIKTWIETECGAGNDWNQ